MSLMSPEGLRNYQIKMLEGDGAYDFYKNQFEMNQVKLQENISKLNALRMKADIYGSFEDERKNYTE